MVEVGRYALYLLLGFCLYSIGMAMYGALARRPLAVKSAERGTYACFGLLCLIVVALWAAMLGDRFDISFVNSTSSREQPWPFKLAIWGGQAGSLLLWAWMLGLMSALATFQNRARSRDLMPWVIAAMNANLLFFVALICFSSNPFEPVIPSPAHSISDGSGLNPLLQHPVMLIHPPILYVGFVGFAVPFSFAFAALVTGKLDTTWFRSTRRWTLMAWAFLGVGILLGGRWAYEVLGWGGYWAWDPVENSSLIPWLVATAYLHSVIIQEKRGMLKIWNLVLIGLTYSLCLFGTFLTRSGVVQSVHAFADAGWIGTLFLIYTLAMGGLFLGLLIWRIPQLRSPARLESLVSREGSFLVNNYLFMSMAVVVLILTLYPAYSQLVDGIRKEAVPAFYQRYMGPLSLLLLLLTGIGPLIAWRKTTLTNLRKSFLWPAALALLTGIVLGSFGASAGLLSWDNFYPWAIITLCAFVIGTIGEEYARGIAARMRHGESLIRAFFSLIGRNQRRYAGYIVHLSVVLMFIGFAGAAFDIEATKLMRPGDRWQIRDYTLEYRGPQTVVHPHYRGAIARLALWRGDEPQSILVPEKRIYYKQGMPTTLPAVQSDAAGDFYVLLNAIEPDQSVALKVHVNPLVNWIWIGGWVFVIGNTLLLWPWKQRATAREA